MKGVDVNKFVFNKSTVKFKKLNQTAIKYFSPLNITITYFVLSSMENYRAKVSFYSNVKYNFVSVRERKKNIFFFTAFKIE